MMLIVLGLTAAVAFLIFPAVAQIFLASPYLKIFIVVVFLIGVAACFWQVFTLIQAVNWIEGFALDRPGHEFTKAPRLLAPLAAMLSGRQARIAIEDTQTIILGLGTQGIGGGAGGVVGGGVGGTGVGAGVTTGGF